MGRSGGVTVIWDPHALELIDSRIVSFSVYCEFNSLDDNFVWGLICVYGPNDENLCSIFLEELRTFMSLWDIPWC